MIKAKMSTGNLFLGLSQDNIRRLRAGQDLCTDCFSVGVNCRVLITVVAAHSRAMMIYTPNDRQPKLFIAIPDNHLQRLIDAGLGTLHTRKVGAPFELLIHVGETEQAIIDSLGYTGPVVNETGSAAGVH